MSQDTFERNQRGRYMETLKNLINHLESSRVEGMPLDAIRWAIERIEDLENDNLLLASELDELRDDIAVELMGEDR